MTGILGTQASVYSDMGLILEVLTTLLFTFGYLIEKKKGKHCIAMGAALATNIVFVISYMVSRLLREEVPAPPLQFDTLYRTIVIFHGILSIVVLVLATSQVFFAYRWRKKKDKVMSLGERRSVHKKLGFATLIMWYVSFLSGIIIYTILYVL